MPRILILLCASLAAWQSAAEGAADFIEDGKAALDLRYRFENVEQDDRPETAEANTIRVRLDLSSGAMTNRLDNMEVRGLIRRLDDPDDRRGVIVELTDAGRELWDATVAAQAEKESLVDSVLGEREKRQLNDLLRRLMHAFEDVHGPVHPPHD